MKQIAFFALTLCLLFSCGTRREYKDALMRAEAAMDEHPDSAMMILDSLGQHESEFNRHFRMQYQLHRQNAVNKTSDKFTSDSLCQVLVSYFDRHGQIRPDVLHGQRLLYRPQGSGRRCPDDRHIQLQPTAKGGAQE